MEIGNGGMSVGGNAVEVWRGFEVFVGGFWISGVGYLFSVEGF